MQISPFLQKRPAASPATVQVPTAARTPGLQRGTFGSPPSSPSAAAALQAASQGGVQYTGPNLTPWTPARPSAENSASVVVATVPDNSTTTAALKVGLLSGGTYTFSAGAGYNYTAGKRPSLNLTLEDSSGRVVKTSRATTLTLSRTESSRLASGAYTFRITVVPPKGATANLTSYSLTARQELSQLPASSGNADLNAVLASGPYWWHDVGAVATVGNTAITDTVKQISGARSTLRYQFLSGNEAYLSNADRNGFAGMNAGQKQAVVSAMSYLSSLINVTFVEDGNNPDIVFGTNDQANSAGYSHYPLGNGGNPTVLMLDNVAQGQPTNTSSELQDKTSYGWHTLVHELGHAMGLKHPGSYNAGGGRTPGPYLSSAKDHRGNTVMSYRDAPGSANVSASATNNGYSYSYSSVTPIGYMTLDIAALQYLYGAKTSTNAPAIAVNDNRQAFETVWAPNGVSLSAAATTRSNIFDMRPGGYSSIAVMSSADLAEKYRQQFRQQGVDDAKAQGFAGSLVNNKNLKGKFYDGRNTLGLAFGSRYTSVSGGGGSDRFYAGLYSAEVNGGAGVDTLFLQGTARDWTSVVGQDGVATHTHKTRPGVVITARAMESIKYYSAAAAAV